MAKKPNSFMNWLGRQIGHVKGAVQTPVPAAPKVVYRKETIQQAALPDRPQEILRRTTIDEVVIPPSSTPLPKPDDHSRG
jgi:hypothetical protein